MTIFQAFTGAITSTLADQWKDIIAPGVFDELAVLAPGQLRTSNNGRGANRGSAGVITNGSKIFVPENTAAIVFSQGGIETVITQPGGYEYWDGQSSMFDGSGFGESVIDQVGARFAFGGQTSDDKRVAYLNLREIRGIKFGTRGPLVFHDLSYDTDLEIRAFGAFSVRVIDPVLFVRSFIPPNTFRYDFGSAEARRQLISEFVQSFAAALNALSATHRISQLPSQAHLVAGQIASERLGAGSWPERFGLEVIQVGIENIEFTDDSRDLVREFSSKRMSVRAYEGVDQATSDIAAQQQVARGVGRHGLGDGGGLLFGMNLARSLDPRNARMESASPSLSFDEQVEAVRKMKDLLDAGLLTEEQFERKKKEIMGL